jgi:hypothetical protein
VRRAAAGRGFFGVERKRRGDGQGISLAVSATALSRVRRRCCVGLGVRVTQKDMVPALR